MGQRGPKPKLKILPGVPARAPSGRGRIKRGVPPCPEEVTGAGAVEWGRVVAILDAAGMLAEADTGILTAYCLAFMDMLAARAEIAKSGRWYYETTQTSKGEKLEQRPKEHPAVKLLADASRRVEKFGAALGLTPASRARLEGDSPESAPAAEGNKVVAIRERFQSAN